MSSINFRKCFFSLYCYCVNEIELSPLIDYLIGPHNVVLLVLSFQTMTLSAEVLRKLIVFKKMFISFIP